jgi:hypothetical protein
MPGRSSLRRFAEGHVEGLNELLSGNTLFDSTEKLRVELPDLDSIWPGRRNLELA